MTIPWLMNCGHREDGWCLECTAKLGNELWAAQERIAALESELRAAEEIAADWQDMRET